jgi:hypothetical protein
MGFALFAVSGAARNGYRRNQAKRAAPNDFVGAVSGQVKT